MLPPKLGAKSLVCASYKFFSSEIFQFVTSDLSRYSPSLASLVPWRFIFALFLISNLTESTFGVSFKFKAV